MNIQNLGSIGELIAAITTILTLIYLARQVRENTKATETASRVEITRDYRKMHNVLLDAQVNLAWATGLRAYPNMPFEMRARFAIHFTDEALCLQGVFAQFENRQLEEETYYAYLNWFSALVATPGGAYWWEETGRPIYVGKMVAAVDKCVAQGNFPDVRKLSAWNLDDSDSK